MEHGASTYTNHGCRCDICREAHRKRSARRREERKVLLKQDPEVAPHGRNSTYTNWGCRCDHCRDAHAKKKQQLNSVQREKKEWAITGSPV